MPQRRTSWDRWRKIDRKDMLPPSLSNGLLALIGTSVEVQVLDGIVQQDRVATVPRAALQPWMTGIGWKLADLAPGGWGLLNQNLQAAALTASQGGITLSSVNFDWPHASQTWQLFHDSERDLWRLRSALGGWLALSGQSLCIARQTFNQPEDIFLWRLADAPPLVTGGTLQPAHT